MEVNCNWSDTTRTQSGLAMSIHILCQRMHLFIYKKNDTEYANIRYRVTIIFLRNSLYKDRDL